MNVLYVCADRGIPLLGGKGASVHVRAVTSAMQALGHRVTLAVRRLDSGNTGPAVHRIEQLENDIAPAAQQLADLIVDNRIDVVIERYSLQSGAARRATRRHGIPLTLEVNAPLVEEATRYRRLADPNAQAWEHETLRATDRIHVVSSALLRYVQSVAPGVPAEWIPNGSHVAAFRGTEPLTTPGLDGRLVVGFAGSMKPWHGVADLLDAFARTSAPRGEPAPVLLLVGDGPEQEALRRRATAPDLDGRVVFTGALPHDAIPALVRRFDVAVAPYRPVPNFYFHPLKIVEYLAAGVPVVYPDQGDLRELVGAAGLAYPPGARDHLAGRLTRLMNDHVLRRDMAKAAESRGAEFDWHRIAERVLEFARACLTGGRNDPSAAVTPSMGGCPHDGRQIAAVQSHSRLPLPPHPASPLSEPPGVSQVPSGRTQLTASATWPAPVSDHDQQLGHEMSTKMTVIGTGYLGLTHAVCLADAGHDVLGLDVDAEKVAMAARGEVPFFEPGLEALLCKNLDAGRLRFTTSFAEACAFGEVHFLCVGTPQADSGRADLSYVYAAAQALAPHLDKECLVVGKSTVPVGTARKLRDRVRGLAPAKERVDLAWNPEFLREGRAVQDSLSPDRLVFGVTNGAAADLLRKVYAPQLAAGTPALVMDLETAELVKVSANAFLATKISFINAMAEICEAAGADVIQLAEALGHDERIGRKFLFPGLGFGGGCLLKDIRAFRTAAAGLGVTSLVSLLAIVDTINLGRRGRVVSLARKTVGGHVAGKRIAILSGFSVGAPEEPRRSDRPDLARLSLPVPAGDGAGGQLPGPFSAR